MIFKEIQLFFSLLLVFWEKYLVFTGLVLVWVIGVQSASEVLVLGRICLRGFIDFKFIGLGFDE